MCIYIYIYMYVQPRRKATSPPLRVLRRAVSIRRVYSLIRGNVLDKHRLPKAANEPLRSQHDIYSYVRVSMLDRDRTPKAANEPLRSPARSREGPAAAARRPPDGVWDERGLCRSARNGIMLRYVT